VKKKEACASCGLPRRLKDNLLWTVDGNIFTSFKPKREVLLFDHRELGLLVDHAVSRGGSELQTRLKETRRRYSRNRTLEQMEGVGTGLLNGRVYRKKAVLSVLDEASLYGLGRLTVTTMKAPDTFEADISHPYHPDLLAADLAGFWEGFFGVRVDYEMEQKEPYAWTLRLKGAEDKKYHQPERKPIPENAAGKKDKELEKCDKCGLPAALGNLIWDAEKGTIFEPATSRYLAMLEVAGLQALAREMSRHLTTDYQAALRAAFLEYLGYNGKPVPLEQLCRETLDPWPVMGWGKVAGMKLRPFLGEVVVTCPSLPSFIEQKIAACWQLAENEVTSSLGTKLDHKDFRVSVGPQLSEYSINIETLRNRFPELASYPQSFLPF
jgi:hypothetical protein